MLSTSCSILELVASVVQDGVLRCRISFDWRVVWELLEEICDANLQVKKGLFKRSCLWQCVPQSGTHDSKSVLEYTVLLVGRDDNFYS